MCLAWKVALDRIRSEHSFRDHPDREVQPAPWVLTSAWCGSDSSARCKRSSTVLAVQQPETPFPYPPHAPPFSQRTRKSPSDPIRSIPPPPCPRTSRLAVHDRPKPSVDQPASPNPLAPNPVPAATADRDHPAVLLRASRSSA